MSQENVEIVRNYLNAWIEVDEGLDSLQRLAEFTTPDATLVYSGWAGRGEFRGVDEFVKFRTAWAEPYDDWSYEVEEVLEATEDRVVATFHQRGKPRGSDSWVEMHYGFVYTVEEGLISRAVMYATPEEALEAAGLAE